jgi:hypothetical protein
MPDPVTSPSTPKRTLSALGSLPVRCSRRGPRVNAVHAAACLALTLLASGCSPEQVYNAAAGWRRNECYKIVDVEQRDRCLKEADRSYDAYRAGVGKTP